MCDGCVRDSLGQISLEGYGPLSARLDQSEQTSISFATESVKSPVLVQFCLVIRPDHKT